MVVGMSPLEPPTIPGPIPPTIMPGPIEDPIIDCVPAIICPTCSCMASH